MSADNRSILERLRRAVVERRYVVTPHALLAMNDDRLDLVDVESAILTGRIRNVFFRDPRGVRYEVVGKACDLMTEVGVVIRLIDAPLIITVYQVHP